MPRRAEFYFDGTYYRKRIKLPDGRWKDVRARTKEELRSKLYDMETAQRMGLALDGEATVAELAVEWYTNRSAGLSAARQGDYRIAINHHICPVIGAMRVRDVKPEHCQRVMAQAAELSNSAQQIVRLGYFHSISASLIPSTIAGVPSTGRLPEPKAAALCASATTKVAV